MRNVKSWEELDGNDKYIIDDEYFYLSTHSFYKNGYIVTNNILKKCGFDVQVICRNN